MTVLADNEYDLGGVVLGNDRTRQILVLDVDLGAPVWVTVDREDPQGDSRHFGKDGVHGPTWTFSLLVSADSGPEARAVLADLNKVWRNRKGSRISGKLEVLRYRVGGETKRVYGRPRNFAITDFSGLDQGVIECTGQFVTKDALTYDDYLRRETLTIFPDSAPGFTFPVTFPFTMEGSGERQGSIGDVGGNAPAPATIIFTGPIDRPHLAGNTWEVGLTTSLAYDETVTIDSRAETVVSNIRGEIPGALTRRSWFRAMRIGPGPEALYFTGSDPSGRATATVEWYAANDDEI